MGTFTGVSCCQKRATIYIITVLFLLISTISEYQKDSFRFFYEVVHENRIMESSGLYNIENNLIVSKILSLATLVKEKKTINSMRYSERHSKESL